MKIRDLRKKVPKCNYFKGRNGWTPGLITLHTTEGTYEGSGGSSTNIGGIKYAQLSKITATIAVTSLNNEDVEENQLSKINGTLSVTSVEPQEMTLN